PDRATPTARRWPPGSAASSLWQSVGGATNSASSRLAFQQRLVKPSDQILDLRCRLGAVDGGPEFRRAWQALRIPTDMLARDMDARRPIVAEHRLVMVAQNAVLRRKWRIGQSPVRAQPGDDLGDEPGPAVAAAPDHQPIRAGFGQGLVGFLEAGDVAVGDDRDRDGFLDLPDEAPIGLAG